MAYSKDILKVIENFFDELEWKYTVNKFGESTIFRSGIQLEGDLKISEILFNIIVREECIVVSSTCAIKADLKNRVRMAEYICRVNYGLEDGNFELNYDKGNIRYKSYIYIAEEQISNEDLYNAVSVSASMWKRYGNGIVEVLGNEKSKPKTVVTRIEKSSSEN